MKIISIIFVLFLFLCFDAAHVQSETKIERKEIQKIEISKTDSVTKKDKSVEPWNKLCPVKGNEVEYDTPFVEYNGKLYGFCCPRCDIKFAKNPEKYSKNLSEDGKRFIGRR